ncbi:hypothetical protein BF93_16505 [Brachybacterium phenoliresistens]|uniref:Uncharacterized protein n=1 Tax=Brachybacterium phenoliresistens TaxID=396014 RepID=Z9JUT3_9MICO|nr:heparinase II/III family protein [Brachybacterium phenoliresistens]EWS81507.1 hypothetical protein BF93_16505 [Brachybacterium phenoliresistens]
MTHPLLARLETGYFASRASDVRAATFLAEGRTRIGESTVAVLEPASYDAGGDLPRVHALALQSLRWIDPLRRARGAVEGADAAWTRIALAWSRSRTAQDPASDAWRPIPLEQRAVALALGAPEGSEALALIPAHLERLAELESEGGTAERRLQLLRIRLALQLRQGDGPEQLRASTIAAAESAFTADGYAVAKDLSAVAEAARQWEEALREAEVDPGHEIFARIRATGFWRHALAPDGTLVPVGGALPEQIPGAEDPRTRYVITGGEEGSAPEEISRVDPTGLVSLRSGWGETERDARDETLMTMVLGPVRDREAHHDPARLTYHSQGRAWLIDPVDEAASGSDAHSIVDVEDVRYRLHGGAELVRHYADERVEGLMVKADVHLRVQWQRHVVLARTGNYVVVDDTVRSSQEHVAHLQWIVAPDVRIEPGARGFRLHADGRTVALHVSTAGLKDHRIEEIADADGRRIAWRIRVPLVGRSNRAITVVSDVVDPAVFDARRVPRGGKEFTVDIRDKHLDETLVVTPELSAVVPSGLDPEEAVARTIALGAAGDMTPEEALAQRVAVRRAIEEIKAEVRAAGGGVPARERGIDRLLAAGEELRVHGLRDHGYGAALIDLAGTDLADRVERHPQVGNLRRGPLVRFAEEDLVQPGYSVPVRTTLDAGTVPTDAREPFVWSVDLGQLVPSAYLHDAPGDVLTVYFHGATDRTKFTMPRYERLRSMPTLGLGPVMFFSDPCLDLDSRMMLSWYVGTEDQDLHREIARMIDAYARHRGIEKVLLVGNSGGGFAALQQGAYLEGARVVSFNPQIQVDRYVPRIAEVAHWALFGRDTVSDDPVHAPRMDLIERYRRIGFDQDVLLIQNPGDDHHHQEHFLPFTEAFAASERADRLRTLTPYLGPGHRVPGSEEYLQIVRDEAAAPSDRPWRLRGLRDLGS